MAVKKEKSIRIHRFGDNIAFDTTSTETLYLSPDLARMFAEALIEYADDCERSKFSQSPLGTKEIEEPEPPTYELCVKGENEPYCGLTGIGREHSALTTFNSPFSIDEMPVGGTIFGKCGTDDFELHRLT